jgi:hypothetical protein
MQKAWKFMEHQNSYKKKQQAATVCLYAIKKLEREPRNHV